MKKETKKYSCFIIVFFVFMNLRFHCLKIKNLKTNSKHRSAPRAVRQKAQLAERCHSVFSLLFYVFNLRAGVKLVMRTIVGFGLSVLFGSIEIIFKISCFYFFA